MGSLLSPVFRAGFEPLSWRGDYGAWLRELKAIRFLGDLTTHAAAQNRRGLA
jgi:hypothetical protein